MKKILILIILIANSILSYSQSEVELQIQLLTPDLIGEVTLDKEPFFEWVKNINSGIETYLKKEVGDKEVVILISLHMDSDATISIGARPKIKNETLLQLSEIISKNKSPRTIITDYSFAIIARVNKGCEKEMDHTPSLVFPLDREIEEFKNLELSAKKSSFQNWIRNEVIPIITHYEISVDSKFEGVLNIGKSLEQKEYLDKTVEDITDKNSDYWRAIMEMSGGNQLLPFTKACLYIEKGEFDKASRLLFVINIFSDESTLPAAFHEEISIKLSMITEQLGKEINAGIALHDKGKYNEAIKHYESLLKIFPHSAWLNYEIYYSKTAEIDIDEVQKEWAKSKELIYSCDPMYHMNVHAKSGKEGYLLFRRQEVNSLFQTNEKLKPDFITYADIAFELENYGFAAQLYWLILSYFSKEDYIDRNILAYYLYCLDKLGDNESIKNFKGDFKSEFARIEQERQKIMKESPMYNSFETKE